MSKVFLILFVAITMLAGMATVYTDTDGIQNAEAVKGNGVYHTSTGSSSNICGLMLCSEYIGGRETYQQEWTMTHLDVLIPDNPKSDNDDTHDNHGVHSTMFRLDNLDENFPAQVDVYINRFDLDKISADETLVHIDNIYAQYTGVGITNDIIDEVGAVLKLYESGTINAAETVYFIHLAVEPHYTNAEFVYEIDQILQKHNLEQITDKQALEDIKDVYLFRGHRYATSQITDEIFEHIVTHYIDRISADTVLDEIHQIMESAKHEKTRDLQEAKFTREHNVLPTHR